jgi:succinate-semialdehyde dehydrogenase/glutarate-semialdehyde dehydrogenase
MAGNALLLKHSSSVPGCARVIERLIAEAGFPEGLFGTVFLDGEQTGQLIEEPSVAAVTLTGGEAAGRAVAARAGRSLKKCVLELGGSDAYVVLKDADVERAARTCVQSRLINGGQSCIAAKRLIVVQDRVEQFQNCVLDAMKGVRWGDPLLEETDVGPLAREDLRDGLHEQVTRSVSQGASLLLGGTIPERPGAWYPPTVLADVQPGMPASDEELFGPVAAILPARDDVHAVQLANATGFGLGAAVFTRADAEGERIARRELCAGSCFVNTGVHSDPRLPFGGIKRSGFGRELGRYGMLEFVNVKTVFVA